MMAAKYSLETSHFCLFLSLFMMKFILSSAVCSGLRQLENGRTFFRYGGIYATFTCNPGFRLLGHVSNSCIKGKWRKPVPVCVASGCQLPTGIVHGSLHTSHKDAAITFSCKEGYKLFGSAFIYCNGRRWNSTIPVCRESDMMSSSLRRKHSETSSTTATENPSPSSQSSEALHRILHNTIPEERDNHHRGSAAKSKDADFLAQKSSYQHQEIFMSWSDQSQAHLSPGEVLRLSKPSIGEHNDSVLPSMWGTHTNSPMLNGTVSNILNKMSNSTELTRHTRGENRTLETILYKTATSNYQPALLIRHKKKASNRSLSYYLRTPTTPSKADITTWTRSAVAFSDFNNKNSHSVGYTFSVLIVEGLLSLKTTSNRPPVSISTFGPPKYITGSENLTYNTDFSRHGNSERKQGANIQPIINLLPVTLQEQITVSSITKADMNATAKLESITTKRPKPNATQGTDVTSQLNKTKHRTIHLTTTPALTPLARTPMITKANSNEIQHGSLKKTFRRRMWCFYPPVPNHGTFRFLTLENPLPNQYPYYIQYYCYPGYTMTRGDVYSFCLESGAWSGVIPTCEGS
ncbi:uncharacterized protein [Hyperolius riggenbachi]|uniref:uncharacterized protein n=1 Tax=Hyperolius riggenbachi TaxID=752182 RepID=UPI0035A2E511